MIVTLEALEWLDRCPRRLWLDHHADAAARVAPARDALARSQSNRVHAAAVLERVEGAAQVPPGPWERRVQATADLVQQGAPLIAGGAIEAPLDGLTVRGTPHLLRRALVIGQSGPAAYTPVDIRLHGEATRWDKVRIDVLRWLVAQALPPGSTPTGELWLGARSGGPARVQTRQVDVSHAVGSLVRRLADVVGGAAPPIWFDSDHCPFCPWRDDCDRTAQERDDLAMLSGLRRNHARRLLREGVATVGELLQLPPAALAHLPDSDDVIAHGLLASATALKSGVAVLRGAAAGGAGPGAPALPQDALYLDVETDPASRIPWAVGWMTPGGAMTAAIVAPWGQGQAAAHAGIGLVFVGSPEEAWLAAARAAAGQRHVAHWGDSEQLLLARSGGHAAALLGPLLFDLHAEVTREVALPIARLSTRRTAGLKAVAMWLGYRWPGGADHWSDGWDAYRAWLAAHGEQRGGDGAPTEMLAPALAYLRADLEALALVWRWYHALRAQA